jgi:hypothetical protein
MSFSYCESDPELQQHNRNYVQCDAVSDPASTQPRLNCFTFNEAAAPMAVGNFSTATATITVITAQLI